MVCTELHSHVDICNGCNACRIHVDCLVDHGDQNPVNHKARLVYLYGSLADLGCDSLDLLHQVSGCVSACNHLYQLHSVGRIEEMHADERTIQPVAHLGDGKG